VAFGCLGLIVPIPLEHFCLMITLVTVVYIIRRQNFWGEGLLNTGYPLQS